MKTNIFLNSYQQQENKLTYNFLSIIELLNDKELCEFLTQLKLSEKPVANIKLVYGGGNSNPDGSFDLTTTDKDTVTVYFENKTHRRSLSKDQLLSHLRLCKSNDILLVVTPRNNDYEIIKAIGSTNIKFLTWTAIANFIRKNMDNIIAKQFIEYGKVSGEFEEFGDLTKAEVNLHCNSIKINFEARLNYIFNDFYNKVDFSKYGINQIKKTYNTWDWGRKGLEINFEAPDFTYGQWLGISYYFDTTDHEIPFQKDVPEIAAFFDINPDKRLQLKDDNAFNEIVEQLIVLGFESNLNEEITNNQWRLLVYRKPITDFVVISVEELQGFTDDVFAKLNQAKAFTHGYFNEIVY